MIIFCNKNFEVYFVYFMRMHKKITEWFLMSNYLLKLASGDFCKYID